MSTPSLWSREALVHATRGKAIGGWDSVSGISIDTRTIEPGDLFVALKDQRDGHDFFETALKKGAAAALVSRPVQGCPADAPLLLADDTLRALEGIAGASRERITSDCRIIAVTGSAGKTSVKEALRVALSDQGKTHASEKSYNNHWGVPLSLARMPADTGFGVFEIGMNHPGEITPLSHLVRPHISIITTDAPAHLGNFNDESEIAEAKSEIFDGLLPDGHAVLNADNRWYDLLATKAAAMGLHIVAFGRGAKAQARLLQQAQRHDGASISADIQGDEIMLRLNASGTHHAMNAIAVLTATKLAGADLSASALALGSWSPGAGRGAKQMIQIDPADPASDFLLIDESYNANPVSVAAAFEVLGLALTGADSKGRDGRRIAVLGDMLELGTHSADLHAGLAFVPELADVDLVHCCGSQMRALHDSLPPEKRGVWADTSVSLAERIAPSVRPGDAIMVKGSLGSAMHKVVAALAGLGKPRTLSAHG